MKIRDHEPSPRGPYCKHCGAASISGSFGDQATCNEREVSHEALRPAPARRQYAMDDFDTIGRRIIEIQSEAEPCCPNVASKTLYNCLREVARCPAACPHYLAWIGPQE